MKTIRKPFKKFLERIKNRTFCFAFLDCWLTTLIEWTKEADRLSQNT